MLGHDESRVSVANPSATHDTLQFHCTMSGHEESRVSEADIEN